MSNPIQKKVRTASEKASLKCILTRSEGEAEFLGLDLSDVLWIQLLCSLLAMCHRFVLEDLLFPVWIFNHRFITAPFYQRIQLVTTGRHSLTLFQEVLRAAAQEELKGRSNFTIENLCIGAFIWGTFSWLLLETKNTLQTRGIVGET